MNADDKLSKAMIGQCDKTVRGFPGAYVVDMGLRLTGLGYYSSGNFWNMCETLNAFIAMRLKMGLGNRILLMDL